MVCATCGAQFPEDPGIIYCPKCGRLLEQSPGVSDDTKVGWQGFNEDAGKTVILPDFGEGMPVKDDPVNAGPYTEMKTDPQLGYSPEDFAAFNHFDTYGDDLYSAPSDATVQMPEYGAAADETVRMPEYGAAADETVRMSGYGAAADETVRMPGYGGAADETVRVPGYGAAADGGGRMDGGARGPQFVAGERIGEDMYENNPGNGRRDTMQRRSSGEKYFPNGFLEEHPDIEPERRGQKFGPADFFGTLLGLITLGLCGYILYTSHGWSLIRQFFGGDAGIILENMDDLRFFVQNQEVTWRIFYEIAAMTMIITGLTTVFIIIHCYVKSQVIGIFKGLLLIVDSFFMAGLCGGYFLYFVITISGGVFVEENLSGLTGIAGIAMAAAAVLWFIYMFIWGITSFFKGFHSAVLALLALGFVFSIMLVAFNVLVGYKSVHGVMPDDAMMEFLSTPVMIGSFMLLSIVACIEDYMAKRIVEREV